MDVRMSSFQKKLSMNVPIYIQIAEDIKQQIEEGKYSEGSYIPPEPKLQKKYGVGRSTIRDAIKVLKDQELVKIERGKGTRVVSPQIYQWLKNQLMFTEVIQSQGLKPGTIVHEAGIENASEKIANKLNVPAGSRIFKVGRIRTANDQVISYHVSYLPEEFVIEKQKLEEIKSLYRYLEEYFDVFIKMTNDEITAKHSEPDIAKLLKIKTGEPVLVLNRVAFNENNEAVEYSVSYIRCDRLKYRVTMYRMEKYR